MVSIIVPAYNAERWLPAAVRSVLAQTEQDWELVLVDDGSTDATPGLCDGYVASDARIRVEHTPNAGVSAARNRGLKLCRGQWILFLDADDVMHPDMLRIMLDAAIRHKAEMVSCATYQFHTLRQESEWLDAPVRTPVKERILTS